MNYSGVTILKSIEILNLKECCLCGADLSGMNFVYKNKNNEVFCCRYHREKSNKMLKEFLNHINQTPAS